MTIKLLTSSDTAKLEEFLAPHQSSSMFICSNLKKGGIEYKGGDRVLYCVYLTLFLSF